MNSIISATKQGSLYYKLVQELKSEAILLQSGACITKRAALLQIGASAITKWGR